MTGSSSETRRSSRQTAGAFDIRMIIALLLGAYGILLIVMGLVATSDEELAKADGININLWGGVGMLAAAICFAVWVKLRPIIVPADPEKE